MYSTNVRLIIAFIYDSIHLCVVLSWAVKTIKCVLRVGMSLAPFLPPPPKEGRLERSAKFILILKVMLKRIRYWNENRE